MKKHKIKNPIRKLFLDNLLKTVIKNLKPLNIKTVLDVGCEDGFVLSYLQKQKIGKEFMGIDASEEAIAAGNKRYPKLNLRQAYINKLPYRNNTFDLVIATEVLEYADHPRKVLKELIRVSDKYILLAVPNEPFFSIFNFGKNHKQLHKWSGKKFVDFVKREKIKIAVKKNPFPWTILLLKKK